MHPEKSEIAAQKLPDGQDDGSIHGPLFVVRETSSTYSTHGTFSIWHCLNEVKAASRRFPKAARGF